MNEKRYELELPNRLQVYALTASEMESVKAHCEKALEQAEAEKPKAWDFGLAMDGSVRIMGHSFWSHPGSPVGSSRATNEDVHIIGNLKDMVENQGPIVIGMTEDQADIMAERLRGYVGIDTQLMRSRIQDAHERYRVNLLG